MPTGEIAILKGLDRSRIEAFRRRHEFFWADLALADGPGPEELAEALGLTAEAARALCDFEPGGAPSRRLHVESEVVVFALWCAEHPDAPLPGGGTALGIFRVNVLLHGDFLLTFHEREFDLPGVVAEGGIPLGRSERYAVYVALDGMVGTLVEALAAIERQIGKFESEMMESGLREEPGDREVIRSLRSRLTTLRLLLGPARAVLERVGEEIEQISSLEPERGDYVDRVRALLDRTLDRVDAASEALTNALQVKLNETTYRLTFVATIFLPLSFIVGFFGMNFAWMVDHIDSAPAFWGLGVGSMVVPLLVILLLLYAPRRQRRSSTTTGI